MGVSLPQAEHAPVSFVEYEIFWSEEADAITPPFSLETPRGPPVA